MSESPHLVTPAGDPIPPVEDHDSPADPTPPVQTTTTTQTTEVSGPPEPPKSFLHREIRNLVVLFAGAATVYLAIRGLEAAQIGLVTFFIQQATAISTERTALKVPGKSD